MEEEARGCKLVRVKKLRAFNQQQLRAEQEQVTNIVC